MLAVLTLLGGSIAALRQTDLKRLLAYSSIAHAGYVLIGVQAGTPRGLESALVYLFVYSFMTIGAFAVVVALDHRDDTHSIDDLRALGRRRPIVAALLAFFLLAQAGIPPTAGFIAKLNVFAAAAAAHSYALLIVGVVTSVIAAFFYLKVILTMYADGGRAGPPRRRRARGPARPGGRRRGDGAGRVHRDDDLDRHLADDRHGLRPAGDLRHLSRFVVTRSGRSRLRSDARSPNRTDRAKRVGRDPARRPRISPENGCATV